ncbi:MAG: lysylphosphatidylglycerol synthase domain-containing protein [Planctomycetota bacterium]|jgi:uncharacterized membrane protein YbhN (UPF0104 family)
MSRKWTKRGIRLAVLALLIGLAWRYLDFAAMGGALAALSLPALAVMILLAYGSRASMAFKWRDLCRGFAPHVPYTFFLTRDLTASFLNYSLPSTVGGDVYRGAALTQRLPGRGTDVLAAFVVERGVGILATLVAAWAVSRTSRRNWAVDRSCRSSPRSSP